MIRAAVITVSDSASRGERDDLSGDAIAERLAKLPATVVKRLTVSDDVPAIAGATSEAADDADLVVLTGGTGLAPRDVTPQALDGLLDYEIPGMAEAMRAEGLRHTAHAMLSRQRAGVMGATLVLALPGSPRGATESLDAVWNALTHAMTLIRGDDPGHGTQPAIPVSPEPVADEDASARVWESLRRDEVTVVLEDSRDGASTKNITVSMDPGGTFRWRCRDTGPAVSDFWGKGITTYEWMYSVPPDRVPLFVSALGGQPDDEVISVVRKRFAEGVEIVDVLKSEPVNAEFDSWHG